MSTFDLGVWEAVLYYGMLLGLGLAAIYLVAAGVWSVARFGWKLWIYDEAKASRERSLQKFNDGDC